MSLTYVYMYLSSTVNTWYPLSVSSDNIRGYWRQPPAKATDISIYLSVTIRIMIMSAVYAPVRAVHAIACGRELDCRRMQSNACIYIHYMLARAAWGCQCGYGNTVSCFCTCQACFSNKHLTNSCCFLHLLRWESSNWLQRLALTDKLTSTLRTLCLFYLWT